MGNYDELEIDLRDLFLWLLRYWYIFLSAIIVGCFLGGSLAVYKNHEISNTTQDKRILECQEPLTPSEIKEVDDIVANLNFAKSKRDAFAAEMNSTALTGEELADAIRRVDYWNSVYTEQRNLATALVKEKKDYYEALTADPDKQPEYESIPKYIALGGIGLLLCIGLCFCGVYVFTPSIKTIGELTPLYSYPVLADLLRTTQKEMFSTDISIIAKNASLTRLAFLYEESSKTEKDTAEELVNMLKTQTNISANILSPLSSPTDLKTLSESDSVIIFVSIKKTKRAYLQELISYCKRYGCNVLGFAAISKKA